MIIGEPRHVPKSKCTKCGTEQDAASCYGADKAPVKDDITICLDCGNVMAFKKDLTLRALTDDELIRIAGDVRIADLQWARTKERAN